MVKTTEQVLQEEKEQNAKFEKLYRTIISVLGVFTVSMAALLLIIISVLYLLFL